MKKLIKVTQGKNTIIFCVAGAPAVGSFPHFLHAHPKHLENVKGLMPNKSLHESEVMIEPVSIFFRESLPVSINYFFLPRGHT